MAAKQLSQSIPHSNCNIPYTIGKDWQYLSNSSTLFKYVAKYDGMIYYSNDQLLVIGYSVNNTTDIKILYTPYIQRTTSYYALTLRYRKTEGNFKKGDILYEYDNFINGIPTPGYNLSCCFLNWFGYNYEDGFVISEHVHKTCKSVKSETLLIPIMETSIFKFEYPNSKYQFIPEVGQHINGTIAFQFIIPRTNINVKEFLNLLNVNNFSNIINDPTQFKLIPEISRINNAIVTDIKIHKIKNTDLVDKQLSKCIKRIKTDYYEQIKNDITNISTTLGKEIIPYITSKFYVNTNIPPNMKHCCYLIELQLTGENLMNVGDKMANRYANKGVVSLILPNKLRPIIKSNNIPIDIILDPISVFSRMNLGQIIECIISKVILKCHLDILDNQPIKPILLKLSKLALVLGDEEYHDEIQQLVKKFQDKLIRNQFKFSVKLSNLYFEAPSFINIDFNELLHFIKTEFNIEPYDTILIKRETIKFMNDKLGISPNILMKDINEFKGIFCGSMYFLKLRYESYAKYTARDFGKYSIHTKTPIQGHKASAQSSKIGQMELDALIAAGCINCVQEVRTVKSHNRKMKIDLISQFLDTGEYNMIVKSSDSKSYVKQIIESLITFLNY
jgi:DNA-directed RNA polymerase beta subunit